MAIEKGQTDEREAQAVALAKEVARATLTELQAKFQRDLECLKVKLPSRDEQAVANALDVKYMRDRQMTLILNLASSEFVGLTLFGGSHFICGPLCQRVGYA